MAPKNQRQLTLQVFAPCLVPAEPSALAFTPLTARLSQYPNTPVACKRPVECPLDLNIPFEIGPRYVEDMEYGTVQSRELFSTKLFRENETCTLPPINPNTRTPHSNTQLPSPWSGSAPWSGWSPFSTPRNSTFHSPRSGHFPEPHFKETSVFRPKDRIKREEETLKSPRSDKKFAFKPLTMADFESPKKRAQSLEIKTEAQSPASMHRSTSPYPTTQAKVEPSEVTLTMNMGTQKFSPSPTPASPHSDTFDSDYASSQSSPNLEYRKSPQENDVSICALLNPSPVSSPVSERKHTHTPPHNPYRVQKPSIPPRPLYQKEIHHPHHSPGRGMGPAQSQFTTVQRLRADAEMWKQANQVKKGVYVCTHCTPGKGGTGQGRFKTLAALAAHFDEYNLTRLCKCDYDSCAWSIVGFSSRSEKTRHIKSQHNATHFECPECHKFFLRTDSLKRHFKLIHNKHNISADEIGRMSVTGPTPVDVMPLLSKPPAKTVTKRRSQSREPLPFVFLPSNSYAVGNDGQYAQVRI